MARHYDTSEILAICSGIGLKDQDVRQYIELIANQSIDDLDIETIESAVGLKFFRFGRIFSQVGCHITTITFWKFQSLECWTSGSDSYEDSEEEDEKEKYSIMNRYPSIDDGWKVGGNQEPDRIFFNVDRQVKIVGFGIYGTEASRMMGKIEVNFK